MALAEASTQAREAAEMHGKTVSEGLNEFFIAQGELLEDFLFELLRMGY
jgi:hypothetical protein